MRETRKSQQPSQTTSLKDGKTIDVLHEAIEQEYSKLYRQIHKKIQQVACDLLRDGIPTQPPRPLSFNSIVSKSNEHDNDAGRTVTVTISDGYNHKPHKSSTIATLMPSVSSIRELISYVPTTNNIATRGHLTGIPYLGDKFDDDDQEIIDAISGESRKQSKPARKKKLDDQSLEILYRTLRSDEAWLSYSNEQLIDAILEVHRDPSARARLVAFVNPVPERHESIDLCETIDVSINELIIKSWCKRFCPRCYTYNCLLHDEGPSHLPLPKRFSIAYDTISPSCSISCYKHERERLKRSLSPSHTHEFHQTTLENLGSTSSESTENVKKRRRRSTPFDHLLSPNPSFGLDNENHPLDFSIDSIGCDDSSKKSSAQCFTRSKQIMQKISGSTLEFSSLANQWTLTDRSLFRLFYFLFDGDLCSLKDFSFSQPHTCQDMYEQFIMDTQFFSTHLSMIDGLPLSIRQSYRRRQLDGSTRAFLLHIKKHSSNNQKSPCTLKPAYQPCTHEGPCTSDNLQCFCMQRGTYCEKFCNCPIDCPHRFPGCVCKGACLLNNCLCCAEGRECDPDLCHKCGASLFLSSQNDSNQPMVKLESEIPIEQTERKSLPSLSRGTSRIKLNNYQSNRQHSLRSCRIIEPSYKPTATRLSTTTKRRTSQTRVSSTALPTITCANISLQRKLYKQVLIAESDIAGYGAFLGSPIAQPGDLIAEYTGEIISEDEADRRGRLYDKQACSYLFNLDTNRCVDARQFGGKIRFANHSSKPNCVPKIKLVNGDYRIGIYAKQVIFQGEELFFEYMYDAHQRQQFVNNERVDNTEQEGLTILKRFGDNVLLVRPCYD